MPSPSEILSTLRPELAGSLMEFELAAGRAGFIAPLVLPVIEVAKQSGSFGKIPIEQLLQSPSTDRASGAGYSRGKWSFTKDAFACDEQGWEEPVDDRESAMYADYFVAEQVAAARALDIILRAAELRVSAAVFNATTWTGAALTTAITHEWDDATNAVPRADVKAAMSKVWDGCGIWPNTLIVNKKVFENLKDCASVVDRLKYAGFTDPRPGTISAAAIAQALGIDQVIVAGSPYNTAKEGQDVSISPIWSDEYAMVCKVAKTQDIREPCIGRTLHWGEDGSSIGGTVESYRDESSRSDIIRVRHDVDEKILYAEAGHLLSNVTTI